MRSITLIFIFVFFGCQVDTISSTKEVDLSQRSLKAIPDSIFRLKNLESLILGNSYTSYPPLSTLPGGNHISRGPDANSITLIPSDIGKLKRLTYLNIAANSLVTLPDEISELTNLDTLILSFNEKLNLSEELDRLMKLKGLTYLNIVGIKSQIRDIEILRKKLPNTKIIATMKEFAEEPADVIDPDSL